MTTYTGRTVTATSRSAPLATTRENIEHSAAAHAPFRARAVLNSRVRASSSESDTSTVVDKVTRTFSVVFGLRAAGMRQLGSDQPRCGSVRLRHGRADGRHGGQGRRVETLRARRGRVDVSQARAVPLQPLGKRVDVEQRRRAVEPGAGHLAGLPGPHAR